MNTVEFDTDTLVLVTGGEGFIGGHLCAVLASAGCRVISLDYRITGAPAARVPGVEYRQGHTKDIARLVPERPDLIFHLGEYSRTEISLAEPARVWDLNVAGTLGVLEFWRGCGAKLVYAGSSTKFADGGLGRDQSPYTWSKAAGTELVRNYGEWYGLPYAIAYFYNVYGPGERAGKYGTVIEIFRQQFLRGAPLTVRSPGTQQRIFTHVADIIEGLVLIGERGEGDEFGLGAERAYSILDIARLFGGTIQMLPEAPGNRMGAKLDASKSYALGWAAKRDVIDYIKAITESV